MGNNFNGLSCVNITIYIEIIQEVTIKSYKKTVIAILLAVVLCSMACIEVFADDHDYSEYLYSSQYVTNTWKEEPVQILTSQFANPDTGNAGVYFYAHEFNMASEFIRDENRTATIMLMERDNSDADGYIDDEVCEYTGYFDIDDLGNYSIMYYSREELYDEAEIIEYASTVELYIKVNVQRILGDTTNNIKAQLLRYRIWVD